ncbi:MAG: hypothetical protein WD850_00730 [Candidatus Spechtbacterales bacterium]
MREGALFLITVTLMTIGTALMVLPQGVFAHGTGASFEADVDQYRIDVGYEPEQMSVDIATLFDFLLQDRQTGEDVAFSDVWVRISQGNQTVFASGVARPRFGTTTLTYLFPRAGSYELSVRFQNQGEAIVESTFPLTVKEGVSDIKTLSEKKSTILPVTLAFAGGAVIAGAATLFMRRPKK